MGRWRRSRRTRGQDPPRWPDATASRPRVLVEHPDPTVRDVVSEGLDAAGYEVLTCGGPMATGPEPLSCPVLHQQGCAAIDGADAIVTGLSLARQSTRLILGRTRRRHPDLPIVVAAPKRFAEEHGEGLPDARVCPLTIDGLVTALDEVVQA